MKRIFFSTLFPAVGEINQKIKKLTLINFRVHQRFYGQESFKNETGVISLNLKKIDIENLLQKMQLNLYDYNFIKVEVDDYNFILKEGFEKFFLNCETELLSNIQSRKIEDIDKEYAKIMFSSNLTITSKFLSNQKSENYSSKNWIPLVELSDDELEVRYGMTRKEIEIKIEQQKIEYEKEKKEEELKKIILKSLYYLQTIYLTLEELEELIEIYNKYVDKIDKLKSEDNKELILRHIIHSICMLEKIYMTSIRLIKSNRIAEKQIKIFKILSNKVDEYMIKEIRYSILEEELIKCLLFKPKKSEDYIFKKISQSFYLTTPLRMNCFSYVKVITTIDYFIKERIKERVKEKGDSNKILEKYFSKQEYKKYLTGSKLITELGLNKFIENYYEDFIQNTSTKNVNLNISILYSMYSKYKEKSTIANNYSDEIITLYEENEIGECIVKENILKNISLKNFISNNINVVLKHVKKEDFIKCLGIDYIILLKRKTILENTQNISLDLCKDENKSDNFLKKKYVQTSRELIENNILILNNDYCLVKLLSIKNLDNENFYSFETSVILMNYSSEELNLKVYGTQVITFILKEEDFEIIGKVFQINYEN